MRWQFFDKCGWFLRTSEMNGKDVFLILYLYLKACTAVKILYLASPAWQKLLLSSFTGGIQACLGFFDEKVRSTVAHHRESRQSIYQYFKSRSLHATQINFHKIRFPESRSQIPIPVQFFCQPDLMKSTILFWFERWLKNCFIQNSVDDEYTESMSIWNTDFLSHWSLSLSHICIGKFKSRPRGVKLSFWLTAVSIFNSICEAMNI